MHATQVLNADALMALTNNIALHVKSTRYIGQDMVTRVSCVDSTGHSDGLSHINSLEIFTLCVLC